MNAKKQRPQTSAAGRAVEAERQARLAAALRENLRKRKLQKRARDASAADQTEPGCQRVEGKPEVK